MRNNRLKNLAWEPGEDGKAPNWERVQVAILLDIRDELQRLNSLIGCANCVAIPSILRDIRNNTERRRKAKA